MLDLGQPELGISGGHDDVARERYFQPCGDCGRLDCGDDGLGRRPFEDAGEPEPARRRD
jgi:hypothetical protein